MTSLSEDDMKRWAGEKEKKNLRTNNRNEWREGNGGMSADW